MAESQYNEPLMPEELDDMSPRVPRQERKSSDVVKWLAVAVGVVAIAIGTAALVESQKNANNHAEYQRNARDVQTTDAHHAATSSLIGAHPVCSVNLESWKTCQEMTYTAGQVMKKAYNSTTLSSELDQAVKNDEYGSQQRTAVLLHDGSKTVAADSLLKEYEGKSTFLNDVSMCDFAVESSCFACVAVRQMPEYLCLPVLHISTNANTDIIKAGDAKRSRRAGFGGRVVAIIGAPAVNEAHLMTVQVRGERSTKNIGAALGNLADMVEDDRLRRQYGEGGDYGGGSDDTGSDDTGSDDTGSDDTGSDDTGSDDSGSDAGSDSEASSEPFAPVSDSVGKSVSSSQTGSMDGFSANAHEDAGASAAFSDKDEDTSSVQTAQESAHAGAHASATANVNGEQSLLPGLSATETANGKASISAGIHENGAFNADEKSGQDSATLTGSIGASAKADATGTANAKIDGISVGHAQGSAHADAFAGASGHATGSIGTQGISASVGGKAGAGASVGAQGSASLGPFKVSGHVGASVGPEVGGGASFHATDKNGVYSVGVGGSLAAGLGLKGGASLSVNTNSIGDAVKSVESDIDTVKNQM